jgi:hypothetical protein
MQAHASCDVTVGPVSGLQPERQDCTASCSARVSDGADPRQLCTTIVASSSAEHASGTSRGDRVRFESSPGCQSSGVTTDSRGAFAATAEWPLVRAGALAAIAHRRRWSLADCQLSLLSERLTQHALPTERHTSSQICDAAPVRATAADMQPTAAQPVSDSDCAAAAHEPVAAGLKGSAESEAECEATSVGSFRVGSIPDTRASPNTRASPTEAEEATDRPDAGTIDTRAAGACVTFELSELSPGSAPAGNDPAEPWQLHAALDNDHQRSRVASAPSFAVASGPSFAAATCPTTSTCARTVGLDEPGLHSAAHGVDCAGTGGASARKHG